MKLFGLIKDCEWNLQCFCSRNSQAKLENAEALLCINY